MIADTIRISHALDNQADPPLVCNLSEYGVNITESISSHALHAWEVSP